MFRHHRFAGPLILAAVLTSCERTGVLPTPHAAETRRGASIRANNQGNADRDILELIGKLAISDQPAVDGPVFAPTDQTPASDSRVIAYQAAEKLGEYGKEAFPQLLAHRHDERQSVAFRRVLRHSVGLACYSIIEDLIYNLPEDYPGSFYRTGADGEMHARPRFFAPGIFDASTVEQWLKDREDKSLTELQIEALEWLIAKEEAIGFAADADREQILVPLQRQVSRLKAARAR